MAFLKTGLSKHFIKRLLIVAGSIVLLVVGVHLWFVHNARAVLKEYIWEQSNGKIKIELSALNLNLLLRRLQIHEADLISTDTLNESITYRVSFNRLSLNVGSISALLFQKKLLLDSLKIYDPVVHVLQWRKDTARATLEDELSIPQEMGKFYNSLIDALDEFAVRRIVIDNAEVNLINKMRLGSEPVTVKKIFLDLSRTPYIRDNDVNVFSNDNHTVQLQSFNQRIALPGGRHRLSFKSFNLQLLRKRIELDSCTVTAIATDSIKSSYSVFFKKLSLTGVDFEAMSVQNVIKADSVFCEDPYFDINLYRSDTTGSRTEIPDANKIIQELTGDLNLAFVGVKNAGIHFAIYGKTKRSFSNANKDNFEMHDFRIDPDSIHPVSISGFDMILRDYSLYNEDSTSVFSFDSLHFLNSKVILNNFAINSTSGTNKVRDEVSILVPYFELTRLNWYELIFDQNLAAEEAILNNPDISYVRRRPATTGKKSNLFDSLKNLDSLLTLENVLVKNGRLKMQLGPTTSFNVENIDFNIYSNKLLNSTDKEGVRSAVEHLSFSKGVLRLKDITATLQAARFSGDNLVFAEKVSVTGQGNKIAATVNNVNLDNMQLDDNAETIEVDGFRWESAVVKLNALPRTGKNGNKGSSTIHLRNIDGRNTLFNFSSGSTGILTYIQSFEAASLLKQGDDFLTVEGFTMEGGDLLINGNGLQVNADSYKVSSVETSSLTNVRVTQIDGKDSLQLKSSEVKFNAKLNDLIAHDIHLMNVHATTPIVTFQKWDTAKLNQSPPGNRLPVRIDTLTATEPEITITTHRRDSVSVISIPQSENSTVGATGIIISPEGLEIGSLLVNTNAAFYTKTTGEVIGIENGKIGLHISDIRSRNHPGLTWRGSINSLFVENAKGLSFGKTRSHWQFNQAAIGNLSLSSQSMLDFDELVKANAGAWLRIPQGEFIDSNTTFKWYNARFANATSTLSLDSLVYHPTQPLDSVLAYAPYQLDYITLKTGGITIDGLDMAQYKRDSSIIANSIRIDNPLITVYRDKLPPFSPVKTERPLPVNIIKNVSLPIRIDSLQFRNGTILYSEKQRKSRKQGDILLSNVGGVIANIKNKNLQYNDSLSLLFKADFMNAAPMVVNFKESYTDSLAGFSLSAKAAGVDLLLLNPMLLPLANVKITSGTLDSMSFSAVGREDIAFGEMDLHYKRLRVKLVKYGDPDQSTFLQKIASFVANSFILKRNNSRRKGVIFYKHSSDQSFVNYLVRITLSGISTSLGVKKNTKLIKQYKAKLKENSNPPVNLKLE